jgi:indolepyruvate ferredoxin oxidoreductase beta subunit
MKYDIILAGVGGQGVLSVATVIALAAMKSGLMVKQSEVHGMAQRGGAVQAHIRMSDHEIKSDLIGNGTAEMILSMEPIESLRYTDYLKPDGILISSTNPVVNIPNYPQIETILNNIKKLPRYKLVDSNTLAKEAGSSRATNMVIVGAAAAELPIANETLIDSIIQIFIRKGDKVIKINKKAFNSGLNC